MGKPVELNRSDARASAPRKPIFDLTAADLEAHPVWECALDEAGEEDQEAAAVRPLAAAEGLAWGAAELCVVRARFQMAGGGLRAGYFSPSTRSTVEELQPVIVTAGGQVPFWLGSIRPGPEDLARLYDLLEEAPSRVFPLRFTSDVPIAGASLEGCIEGFYCLEPGRSLFSGPGAIRVVK
jgi:hypothetical protein